MHRRTFPVSQAAKKSLGMLSLKSALPLVEADPGTVTWFAIQEGPSSFAIIDTFDDEAERDAHLNGKVAAALMAKAGEMLAKPPAIHKIAILADKTPKST